MLRWLFKCKQAYFTTQHFLSHLSVDYIEIHVQFAWYQRGNFRTSDGLLSGNLYGNDRVETMEQQTWQVSSLRSSDEYSIWVLEELGD